MRGRAGPAPERGAPLLALPLLSAVRVRRPARQLTWRWREVAVEARGGTLLGLSFRPLQAQALGLEPRPTLARLLCHPFQLIRLGIRWDEAEPSAGRFQTGSLDWQLEAALEAGKSVILSLGAVKNFGYPEFYVPRHHLPRPLPEGSLVDARSHPRLLEAAAELLSKLVAKYRGEPGIVAWQVEHEAVDPLGLEHSWRLAESFVEREVDVVRQADPSRPVLLSGYLPASLPVRLQQAWRTRDQGDSLAVAGRLADWVGVDHYPRHALFSAGPWTFYLASDRFPRLNGTGRGRGGELGRPQILVTEGQAEPWEAVTTPPALPARRCTAACRSISWRTTTAG